MNTEKIQQRKIQFSKGSFQSHFNPNFRREECAKICNKPYRLPVRNVFEEKNGSEYIVKFPD